MKVLRIGGLCEIHERTEKMRVACFFVRSGDENDHENHTSSILRQRGCRTAANAECQNTEMPRPTSWCFVL